MPVGRPGTAKARGGAAPSGFNHGWHHEMRTGPAERSRLRLGAADANETNCGYPRSRTSQTLQSALECEPRPSEGACGGLVIVSHCWSRGQVTLRLLRPFFEMGQMAPHVKDIHALIRDVCYERTTVVYSMQFVRSRRSAEQTYDNPLPAFVSPHFPAHHECLTGCAHHA